MVGYLMAPASPFSRAKQCLLLASLIIQFATARFVCDHTYLGNPTGSDCASLFSQLPYATMTPGRELSVARWFIEPQYLSKPFTPVNSPRSQGSIVQLPKIWRKGQHQSV